jgi:hypothetical protein
MNFSFVASVVAIPVNGVVIVAFDSGKDLVIFSTCF